MHIRDINFIKQIKFSFLFRVAAMLLSFVLVRYMLEYLGVEKYGIWSVVLSFVTWIVFFDFGISNGVKNKVSESLAEDKKEEASEFVSTGYVILTIFSLMTFIVFYIVSGFLDWQKIFNTTIIQNQEFVSMLRYIFFFILINFTLSIITAVFNAIQKTSLIVFQQFLNNLLSLVMIILLLKFTTSNLIYLAFSYGAILVTSNLIMSLWFYRKFSYLKPKLILFNFKKIKPISSLGMKFFLLQLTIFFMLTTDKIIITQLLGSSYVTNYDILYKYFGAIMIIHGMINSPLWSMYTEAYMKNDYIWITKMLKRMVKLMVLYGLTLLLMISIANRVIKVWLGNNTLEFSSSNYIYISIMLLVLIWHSIFAYFSNGIEKTNIQLVTTLIGAIINIPLSILFVKYFNMGLDGVILATIVSLSIFGIFGPIQAFKEVKLMRLKENKI